MIDTSKIQVKFGGENEPKDNKLIELLKNAYRGKSLVRMVLIKIEGIRPFSDFKPQTSKEYRDYFENAEKKNLPPPVYVYPEKGYFIMSDDYNAFYLYKEKGYRKIMCVLLGESESEHIVEKSKPFQLPAPKLS